MEEIYDRNVPGTTNILKTKTVGIAGCGGLGSNAAIALARAGIGSFILVDFDKVELSNLNRQTYFVSDSGKWKVDALANYIEQINPRIQIIKKRINLCVEDVPVIFEKADLLIEAFDQAEEKQWLIERWCDFFPDRAIICGSGIGGIGKTETLHVHQAGNLIVCGDETTEAEIGLCSARVAIVANMQANEAISWLVKQNDNRQ